MTRAPRARPWLLPLALLLPSCSVVLPPRAPCDTDSDCHGPEICFPDGCGDPGLDIKVQVIHGGTAQELEVGRLQAAFDAQLRRPSVLSGAVSQATATGTVPYPGTVTFTAVGSGLFIPAVPRREEGMVQPSAGQFSLPLSSGTYSSITAAGTDPTIPPVTVTDGQPLSVKPGDQPQVSVTFPEISALLRISGTLVKTVASGPVPVPMEILALHPVTRRPITNPQQVNRSDGSTGPAGAFTLLAPPRQPGAPVVLLARPQAVNLTTGPIVPQRAFILPDPTGNLVLELGEHGDEVTVTGDIRDALGQPVGGAIVYIEGTAEGGGTFHGPPATTTVAGAFTLRSLPSPAGGTLDLWVLPPAASSAGRFKAQVVVPAQGGSIGTLHCPRRVLVRGHVSRPDGRAHAPGVSVRAEPLGGVEGSPTPSFSPQVVTDVEGIFSLLVDPGEYRLDFTPADTLPRVSRRVRVDLVPGPDDQPLPVDVPSFTLWNGRTLTGTVTGYATASADQPAPLEGASVELWRVVQEDGKMVSYPLGQGQTDGSGRYSVVLPTAPPSLQPDGGTPGGG